MKVLCELVTVNRERDAIEPLSDWEGGIAVRICKSGDLPAEHSGKIPRMEVWAFESADSYGRTDAPDFRGHE